MSAVEAAKQRDSLATTLYSLIFGWVIEHLNKRLDKEDCATFIGVVDLSGFQDYKTNKFDQLLHNYANEKVQNFSHRRIFNDRHTEYVNESIPSKLPAYPDNSAFLEMIGGNERSLLSLIDIESARPNPKKPDGQLFEVLNEKLSQAGAFSFSNKKNSMTFGVRHYAGLVEYDVKGFVEKNADALSLDFVSMFRGNDADILPTSNTFIRTLFTGKTVETEQHPRDGHILAGAQVVKKPLRHPSMKRKAGSVKPVGAPTSVETPSVITALENSLSELMETLSDTISWFVFCIKPNEDLEDNSFDARTVKGQLVHMGIPQLVEARAVADYTTSYLFDDFKTRYRVIVEPMRLDTNRGGKFLCRDFITASKWTSKEMAVGINRVFLSESAWRSLEDELRTIENALKEEQKVRKSGKGKSGSVNGDRSRRPESMRSYGSRGDGAESESNYTSDGDGNYYDDEISYAGDDNESHYGSEFRYAAGPAAREAGASGDVELGRMNQQSTSKGVAGAAGTEVAPAAPPPKKKMTRARFQWVCMTWCLTWWIPSFCLSMCGMKRPDIRMAWREKVALCIIIFFMCCFLLFFIIVFGMLLCPKQAVYSAFELRSKNNVQQLWASAYGRVYLLNDVVNNHFQSYGIPQYRWQDFAGQDVSQYFFKVPLFSTYCPGLEPPQANWDNLAGTRPLIAQATYPYHHAIDPTTNQPRLYLEYMNQYAKARLAWPMSYITSQASVNTKLIVIYDNVYDVSAYFNAGNNFLGANMANLFSNFYGKDATKEFEKIKAGEGAANAQKYLTCINNMFYIGTIDHRGDFRCQFSNYILLASSAVLVLVIGVKFLSALQFGTTKEPEDHDKFVICQVPCYTEGPDSLTKTLESLAQLRYDDKRKLIFVIADGMIIGSGNDRPTPRIVLDILGVDPAIDPEPLSFQSLGEGDKQLNMGKVYSGLYDVQGRSTPFIVVVKVGKTSERNRPGNRGKRDSQMILMRFLNRVHFNAEMNPLELELYHHMKNIIGVNPSFYEYILMVDADTEVFPDSLNRMISAMIHDSRIMGICGETLISNEKESWITMIQVYEYFISHHLSKAFESLFGSVTCLPGCFCMYRVRTPTKNVPLLIAPAVVNDYSENNVDTLHLKNLLHLGEDRYLTTLMMKHFPNLKLSFTVDAQCKTNVPDRWAVLLSQRRRWINSTVHNLVELILLPQLCGFCCFSMRFIVFLDLFSTVVQPAGIAYIIYLIYTCITQPDQFPLISIIMIAAIYGLQVIIFLLKRQWAQIGWMLIYIIATPVFGFYIPLYAFWHFDDFSWGNTRLVVGEDGKKILASDVIHFDPKTIPVRKWADFEKELYEKGSEPSESRGSEYSEGSRKSKLPPAYSSPGSVYGAPTPSVYGGSVYGPPATGTFYGAPTAPQSVYSNMGGPSDQDLLREIRRILNDADLMSITKKQVREELSRLFGVDLTSRKATINQFIEEILQGRL
ncbi:hypothetical protein HDU76_004208 [Blyttiomyces sp. JEL0837]|nr:hypothetical protein HDU76_004208 [Blyttiomyces sp. JEL0837]